MDVTVEFVVDVVVSNVFERGSAGGTLEALHVQIFVLYPYENATETIHN